MTEPDDSLGPTLPPGVADAPALAARPTGAPLPPPTGGAPASPSSPDESAPGVSASSGSEQGAPALSATTADYDSSVSPVIPPLPPMGAEAGDEAPLADDAVAASADFVPLRSDPPPTLVATWWLRYMLALSLLVAIGVTLAVEHAIGPGGLTQDPVVVAPHALAAVLLVVWSVLAMVDVERIAPAGRYQRPARGALAALLWLLAFGAPVAAAASIDRLRERFDQPGDDGWAVLIATAVVLVAFVIVWLPFRYVAQQGRRVGAPAAILVGWFWLSLVALVGALAIVSLGFDDMLGEGGLTSTERVVRLAVAYGVPMFVFTLTTWRATTVIDEVVDLRWRRWRAEWEQTLNDMAAQPPPPPEH